MMMYCNILLEWLTILSQDKSCYIMVHIVEVEVIKLQCHSIATRTRRYNVSRLALGCSYHRIVKVKVIKLL
jgi:hypothetical protein